MKKVFVWITALAILISGSSHHSLSQSKFDLNSYFTKDIGLSKEEVTKIRDGKPVAKNPKSRIPDEIFVFGAVYINADPEAYVKFATDLARLRQLPGFQAVGRFSHPPQLSDLKGFAFDQEDIDSLKECKPGDCMIQMAASSIEEFQKAIRWSAPDAAQQVNNLLQKAVIKRLLAYQQKGNAALGQYDDRKDPTEVAKQFKYMLSYSKVLPSYLPDFYSYLLDYPKNKPSNVEDTFQWAKVDFGLKPTLRVVHLITARGNKPGEPACLIAEKQLYSSHYFETALDLSFCIREAGKPGFFLIKAMGSEQAGLTGFKGSIVRRHAVGRSVDSLEKSLDVIKAALETQKS